MTLKTVSIGAVRVGDRVRKHMGDLDALAANIQAVGLIHHVAVWPDLTLAAGHRRLEALKKLGRREITVHVLADVADLAARNLVEEAENDQRKPLTPTEMVAQARKLRERVKEEKRKEYAEGGRKAGRGRGRKVTTNDSNLSSSDRNSRTTAAVIADAVGTSAATLNRAEAVVAAAEAEPQKYGHLPGQMDRTGNVNGAFVQLPLRPTEQQQDEATPSRDGVAARDEPPTKEPGGVGCSCARQAINCLIRIPPDDPQRKMARKILTDWIKANL